MSRDCPDQAGGPRKMTCYNCNEDGHMSRECPKEDKRGKMTCYNCQGEGHMSRDCPDAGSGGGGRGRGG